MSYLFLIFCRRFEFLGCCRKGSADGWCDFFNLTILNLSCGHIASVSMIPDPPQSTLSSMGRVNWLISHNHRSTREQWPTCCHCAAAPWNASQSTNRHNPLLGWTFRRCRSHSGSPNRVVIKSNVFEIDRDTQRDRRTMKRTKKTVEEKLNRKNNIVISLIICVRSFFGCLLTSSSSSFVFWHCRLLLVRGREVVGGLPSFRCCQREWNMANKQHHHPLSPTTRPPSEHQESWRKLK